MGKFSRLAKDFSNYMGNRPAVGLEVDQVSMPNVLPSDWNGRGPRENRLRVPYRSTSLAIMNRW